MRGAFASEQSELREVLLLFEAELAKRPAARAASGFEAVSAMLQGLGLPDNSPALADECQHRNISNGVTGHHSQQRALTYARTGYQAHSLTFGERQNTVNRAHAHIHWRRYRLAMQCRDTSAIEIRHKSWMYERLVVQRIAQRVYYPAK